MYQITVGYLYVQKLRVFFGICKKLFPRAVFSKKYSHFHLQRIKAATPHELHATSAPNNRCNGMHDELCRM